MICFTWSRGRPLSKKMRMKAQLRDSASSIKQARLQEEEEAGTPYQSELCSRHRCQLPTAP